jgi:hypothetical protein
MHVDITRDNNTVFQTLISLSGWNIAIHRVPHMQSMSELTTTAGGIMIHVSL